MIYFREHFLYFLINGDHDVRDVHGGRHRDVHDARDAHDVHDGHDGHDDDPLPIQYQVQKDLHEDDGGHDDADFP